MAQDFDFMTGFGRGGLFLFCVLSLGYQGLGEIAMGTFVFNGGK